MLVFNRRFFIVTFAVKHFLEYDKQGFQRFLISQAVSDFLLSRVPLVFQGFFWVPIVSPFIIFASIDNQKRETAINVLFRVFQSLNLPEEHF